VCPKPERGYPGILIRLQFMVGFLTETGQDFGDSTQLLDEVKSDFVDVYTFSRRSGTPAAKMKGEIPSRMALFRKYRMFNRGTARWNTESH